MTKFVHLSWQAAGTICAVDQEGNTWDLLNDDGRPIEEAQLKRVYSERTLAGAEAVGLYGLLRMTAFDMDQMGREWRAGI